MVEYCVELEGTTGSILAGASGDTVRICTWGRRGETHSDQRGRGLFETGVGFALKTEGAERAERATGEF